jgi:hypothetical protein
MSESPNRIVFTSREPFDLERIGAAAVYCSDGRFGEQIDEFVQVALGLPRYDRVVMPGGPACLAGHFSVYFEQQSVRRNLAFLIEAHGLTRVLLIAHQDCAYYTHRLKVPLDKLEPAQRADLEKAASFVASIDASLQVETYFARKASGGIQFEVV